MSEITGGMGQAPVRAWGEGLNEQLCENCDWSFLTASRARLQVCPFCCQDRIVDIPDGEGGLGLQHPPELAAAFSAAPASIDAGIQTFARRIPFAPRDLNPQNLLRRMQKLYLPMWLVDVDVSASWQVESGFNYQVVSHQSHYGAGGWAEKEVEETRIRWEARLGTLERRFENLITPALEEHRSLLRRLGEFNLSQAVEFQPAMLDDAQLRLPTRSPQDSWPEAEPPLQAAAADLVRQASGADHQRSFSWAPVYRQQHWTQVLLPVYSSYYQDDEGIRRSVLVHGQNGRVDGERRASARRALTASAVMLTLAGLGALFSLAILIFTGLNSPLSPLLGLGLLAAFALGAAALVPPLVVWNFNRKPPSG